MSERIVSKFGGSSMANADSVGLVMGIIDSDPRRRVIVVSAPGRDESHPVKITDMLLERRYSEFRDRFHELGRNVGWRQRDERIAEVMEDLIRRPFTDYRASRGEYLSARMLADLTGSQFVDARELIQVSGDRRVNSISDQMTAERLERVTGKVVIPGFYGVNVKKWIRTLPRDGSDITGAVVARALRAQTYEIFSDTAVMTADPRLHENAALIREMSFNELAALTESGAKIVHPEVAKILNGTGTSINCRNTFDASHPGTWIRG